MQQLNSYHNRNSKRSSEKLKLATTRIILHIHTHTKAENRNYVQYKTVIKLIILMNIQKIRNK